MQRPSLAGKEVIATIKPESIFVSKSPDADFNGAKINAVEATITEMVHMRSNAQVTLDAGFLLKTRIPLSDVKKYSLNVGDKVYVCFSVDALNVLADNGT